MGVEALKGEPNMPLYDVTLQVFAAGGDTITVEAETRGLAEAKAKSEAHRRVDRLKMQLDIQEIVITEEVPPRQGRAHARLKNRAR